MRITLQKKNNLHRGVPNPQSRYEGGHSSQIWSQHPIGDCKLLGVTVSPEYWMEQIQECKKAKYLELVEAQRDRVAEWPCVNQLMWDAGSSQSVHIRSLGIRQTWLL